MLPFFSGQDDDDDALAQGFHLICCLCHALLARIPPPLCSESKVHFYAHYTFAYENCFSSRTEEEIDKDGETRQSLRGSREDRGGGGTGAGPRELSDVPSPELGNIQAGLYG